MDIKRAHFIFKTEYIRLDLDGLFAKLVDRIHIGLLLHPFLSVNAVDWLLVAA